jgi:hypothetical protein
MTYTLTTQPAPPTIEDQRQEVCGDAELLDRLEQQLALQVLRQSPLW